MAEGYSIQTFVLFRITLILWEIHKVGNVVIFVLLRSEG